MWLPFWRRKTNPMRSRAARTSRPDRSMGSLATWRPRDGQGVRLHGLDFDELLACLNRDGIASVTAVLDIKFNRFTDVVQRFGAVVALTDASGQCRHARDVTAIFFLFQNHRVTHWMG